MSNSEDLKKQSNFFLRIYFGFLHLCPLYLIKTKEDLELLRNSGLRINGLNALMLYYNTFTNTYRLFNDFTSTNLLKLFVSIIMEVGFGIILYFDIFYISIMVITMFISIFFTIVLFLIIMCIYAIFCNCYYFIANNPQKEEEIPMLPIKADKSKLTVDQWIQSLADPEVNNTRLNNYYTMVGAILVIINILSLLVNPFYLIMR